LPEKILERIKLLEENIAILEDLKSVLTPDILKKDKTKEWALRYGLYESIQIIIDIACHFVAFHNLGMPKTYSECIELLKKYNYVSEDLAETLIKMIGLRNLLAHEYLTIDPLKLLDFLQNLEDFKRFIHAIIEYL